MSIDWDIEELAGYVLGLSEEKREEMVNESSADELLYEKFEIDLEKFTEIVKALLPYTPAVKSAFADKKYNAFVTGNVCIVKQEFKSRR